MKQKGIIKLIIIIVIAILILSYLGVSIKNVAESEVGKSNFGYIGGLIANLWAWLVDMWNQFASPYVAKVSNFF
ncbi:MAG: hypothetical protein WCW56_00930 [Candidatus Paceibacterota bacterium]|jgi:hypothetical protein